MSQNLRHIACLDDEADILMIAQLALETIGGYQVSVFNCVNSALDGLAACAPDVLLLDYMMPDMNGPAVLKAIQSDAALAHIPVIFMTANAFPPDEAHFLGLGAIGVIAKPFDPLTLPDEVCRIWTDWGSRAG